MKAITTLIALATFLCSGGLYEGLARNQTGPVPCLATGSPVPISPEHPTVYITFERAGNREAPPARLASGVSAQEEKEPRVEQLRTAKFLWLRIHNNTPWAITFQTESLYVGPAVTGWRLCDGEGTLAIRDGVEVNACYQVDSTGRHPSVPPRVSGRIDVAANSWLPPGRSAVFQVRHEFVSDEYSIYVPFNYEWEARKGIVSPDEPQHRAYFYARTLPEEPR